ncbi:hemerythrin domain-containing protein [Amnibacterium sp. CER49]|uniref:hemerythrin domain-containing protein n=1 Tax=Amnibacterium sp. CER49 TaxID=3039161 RepID=UPI00244C8299|nr:hemerythrin domain-containing protein [Amnibacterium sp. CER49]MDH2443449.1 hemerythrin domain-containing protein [Amnibacterium sp. CER49]
MDEADTQDNDVRGWTLDHDQFRGVLADLIEQVRALRADDADAAEALSRWWRSFSGAVRHHFRAEDEGIWPTLTRHAPGIGPTLEDLSAQHRRIESELSGVDRRFDALPTVVTTAGLAADRADLLVALTQVQAAILDHLALEEREAVPVLATRVPPPECRRIERNMVKGLSLREVADLLPRILAFADDAERATMLARLPPPVRLLNRLLFTPRYHRTRATLPLGKRT